jgi:hypothetical protein
MLTKFSKKKLKKGLTSLKKYVIINYAPDACNSVCIRMQKDLKKMQLGVDKCG